MTPNIRVDDEVYGFLKERAEPFADTPNSVLRRVLGLDASGVAVSDVGEAREFAKTPPRRKTAKGKVRRPSKRQRRPRAAAGTLLPEEEYVRPLLQALAQRGGSASARETMNMVGRELDGRLTPADKENLASGGVRWQNRVQFVRLRLVQEGLLGRDSPRGVWALTEAGRTRLAELETGHD